MKTKLGIVAVLGGLCLIGSGPVRAQSFTLTPLVAFNNTNGAYPQAGLTVGADGNLYGATYSGGTNQTGTLFKLTLDGDFTSLYSFSTGAYNASFTLFTNADGAVPYGQLARGTDDTLWGTTSSGTTNGHGTVFQITTNGVMTLLVSFNTTNGANPQAGVVSGNDGRFYGTTLRGGSNDVGTVFQLTSNGTVTVLHSFNSTNGSYPFAGVTWGRDGLLYGATQIGGLNGNGTVFKVTTNGNFTSLFSFAAPVANGSGASTNLAGASPLGGLTLGADGNLYGVARLGGQYGRGTAFRMTTNGVLTVLANFNGTNGSNPEASLLLAADGSFYGTTYGGGTNGGGTIFNLTTNGTITTCYAFGITAWSGSGYTNATGAYLESPLTFGPDGNLYGTTLNGGTGGYGTVFKLALASTSRLTIHLVAGKAVITWSHAGDALQVALEPAGPYSTVSGATSPYTNAINSSRQFFRLIGN